MNNIEKKIDWIFEVLRYLVSSTPTFQNDLRLELLNDSDRIIADIETEKEKPIFEEKMEDALRD